MPCHSIPWQSYIHRKELEKGRAWSLSCEPPLLGQDLATYQDETRHFYEDPAAHFKQYFPRDVDPALFGQKEVVFQLNHTATDASWRHIWPSHLILFKSLLEYRPALIDSKKTYTTVKDTLLSHGYHEVWGSGWNGWEGDEKRRGPVSVWRWSRDTGST